MAAEEVTIPSRDGKCRASQRLGMAVALVKHLRMRYGKLDT
jgi:hypothetical protein